MTLLDVVAPSIEISEEIQEVGVSLAEYTPYIIIGVAVVVVATLIFVKLKKSNGKNMKLEKKEDK